MEVIKESEISELTVPWASSRVSWLIRGVQAQMSQLAVDDVANKSVVPLSVDEVVRVSHKCKVPPFGHKVIHGSVSLVLQGYRMKVMCTILLAGIMRDAFCRFSYCIVSEGMRWFGELL